MFDHLTPKSLVVIWFSLVALAVVLGKTLGVEIGLATGVILLAAAAAPAAIVLFVWRDSAPSTVAELIHEVEHRS